MTMKIMESLKIKLGFEYCLPVQCEGRCGDLAWLWKKEIHLTIKGFSNYHINACVKEYVDYERE